MTILRRQSFVTFCEQTLRLQLTPAWRVLLSVSIDGIEPNQLDEGDRELARQLFGAVDEVPPQSRRTLVWRLGRGSGKTTLASALALWVLFTGDLSAVGPGQLPSATVVAPTKATAAISVRVARELVRTVPALERRVQRKSDTSEGFTIKRTDGRSVAFRAVAASRGGITLRGFDHLCLVLDESEFFLSNEDVAAGDGFAVSDRDLFAAAKPRLHGPALFISTPWPTENLTASLFDANHGTPTTALAALGASTLMRPTPQLLADVEAEMIRDPENAQREIFCIAGARGGSRLFDVASVDGAIDEGRQQVIFAPLGARVGCGGDLGLERDSSAIAVVANVSGVFHLLEEDEIRPSKAAPLVPRYVIQTRFAPVMIRHGVTSIMMDAHYRQSAIEHLAPLSLSMRDAPTGQQGKYDVYMFTRSLLRSGALRLPPSPRLAAQLKAVTQTPLPGGGVKITSPRRSGQGHGDSVSGLVLAVWQARKGAKVGSHAAALPALEPHAPAWRGDAPMPVCEFMGADTRPINLPDLAHSLSKFIR